MINADYNTYSATLNCHPQLLPCLELISLQQQTKVFLSPILYISEALFTEVTDQIYYNKMRWPTGKKIALKRLTVFSLSRTDKSDKILIFVHCCMSHEWESSPKKQQVENNRIIYSNTNRSDNSQRKSSPLQVFWEQKCTTRAFISNDTFVHHKGWRNISFLKYHLDFRQIQKSRYIFPQGRRQWCPGSLG